MTWALQALPRDVGFQLVTAVSRALTGEVEQLRQAGIDVVAFDSPSNVFFENRYGQNMDNRTSGCSPESAPFTINSWRPSRPCVSPGHAAGRRLRPEVVEYLATKGDVSIDVQGYLRRVAGEQVESCQWADKLRLLRHTAILKVNE